MEPQKQKPVHRLGAFISGQISTLIFFLRNVLSQIYFFAQKITKFLKEIYLLRKMLSHFKTLYVVLGQIFLVHFLQKLMKNY